MAANILDLNEKRLEKLPPRQLTRELMSLPAKRRMKVILERADSDAVVTALDANDFFFTLAEIGPDDALPLLALASVDQINHLFDIAWWKKDAIEPARALTWLERLSKASDRKLLEWLHHADFELLIALFKQCLSVSIAPEDIDMVEARESLPPRTIDDVYFWEALYPQYDDLIMHLLGLVFEVNYNFFKELMNHILSAPTLEIEELAYHFHKARLADNAIPDYYDALEIYKGIKPTEFQAKRPLSPAVEGQAPPSFALAMVSKTDLLGQALRGVKDPDLIETLQLEMAALANKVIVADQLSPDNAESLRQAVEKTLAYVNLGLEISSGEVLDAAKKIVKERFLEHLFRLAQAEVAQVRGRMRRVAEYGWIGQCSGGIKHLDGKWFDMAEALLAKTPKIQREFNEITAGSEGEDFFRTTRDIALANRQVAVITAAGHLYKSFGTDPKDLEERLWRDGQVHTSEDITLGVMVLTAAAGYLSSDQWQVKPLSVENWPKLFKLIQPAEMDRAVKGWVQGVVPDPENRALVEAYMAPVLLEYEKELRPFSPDNPPEPYLIPFFIFEEPE